MPTDLELELLKIIWEHGQATVREVHQDLAKKRKIAYTTVLTMMGVLENKGHLRKSAGERAYVYRPAEPKGQVVGRMVDEFIKRVFNGSSKPLLVHLADDPNIPPEDLREIERILKDRGKNRP